jgi:hypothetical protein
MVKAHNLYRYRNNRREEMYIEAKPATLSQIGGCAIGEHEKSIEAIETNYKKHRKTTYPNFPP